MNETRTSTIVVGVDGSDHAARALDWAIGQAKLTGARIHVTSAWHVPAMSYGSPGFVPAVSPPIGESIRDVATEVAGKAAEQVRAAGLEVEATVREGQPADVLIETAEDADLLVVGSRGHGGFVGLLLGSVSAQCAHHAPCPLVIVR